MKFGMEMIGPERAGLETVHEEAGRYIWCANPLPLQGLSQVSFLPWSSPLPPPRGSLPFTNLLEHLRPIPHNSELNYELSCIVL